MRAENRALIGKKVSQTGPALARATAPAAEMVRALTDAGLAADATSESEEDVGCYLLYRILTALPDNADAPSVGLLRDADLARCGSASPRTVKTAAAAMARHLSPLPRARAQLEADDPAQSPLQQKPYPRQSCHGQIAPDADPVVQRPRRQRRQPDQDPRRHHRVQRLRRRMAAGRSEPFDDLQPRQDRWPRRSGRAGPAAATATTAAERRPGPSSAPRPRARPASGSCPVRSRAAFATARPTT